MITLEEIAILAKVSRRTVSRALNDKSLVKPETYDKIMSIVKKYDYKPSLSARALSSGKKKIYFCGYHSDTSLFHNAILKRALEKAKELEGFNVKVEFFVEGTDSNFSATDIDNIVANFDADFLISLPKDFGFPLSDALVKAAHAHKVPVIYLNMDGIAEERMCFVGSDYVKAGKIAAGLMGMVLNQKGRIAVLNKSYPEYSSCSLRYQGFVAQLKQKFPEISIVYEDLFFAKSSNVEIVRNLEQANIDGIYIINPGDYSVCRDAYSALKSKNIKIITNDLLEQSRDLLQNGAISALIYQSPVEQADKALDIAYMYLLSNGKTNYRDPNCSLSILIGECL